MAKKEQDKRFEKFGAVSFVAVSKVNDFVDYLEKGKIMGTRCRECGRRYFPPRADCSDSLSSDMEWFEVTGTAKLSTYSTLRYAPTGFTDEVPYTIAVVDYGDFQIFGRMDRALPEEELRVGMEVTAAVETTPNGKVTYVFRKA